MTPVARIGVLGGAFAPPHAGHLRLAQLGRDRLKLDRVLMMPTARPPHRSALPVDAERRAQWVEALIEGEAGIEVDHRESRRATPSYTVDTLAELQREMPDALLCLLVGGDSFATLHQWHEWRDVAARSLIAVWPRVGYPTGAQTVAGGELPRREAGCPAPDDVGGWCEFDTPPQDVSSTAIRRALGAQHPTGELVIPAAVLDNLTSHEKELLATHDPS